MAKLRDYLPGIGEGLLTSIEKQRDRKAALQDAIALLMAKQQMDPEVQAKQYAMQTIQQQNPEPTMRVSSTNLPSPEMRSRMDTEFQGMQKNRSSRVLDAMQARGLLPGMSQSYATATPQADVQATVAGIKEGRIPPNPNEISFRDRTRVNAELSRQGINLSKLNSDWTAMQAFAKNANSSMQLRMRQALESVSQSVPKLQALNEEFSRTGWTPANAVVLKAAMTGTDPTRRDQATRFLTQINVMKDELAQGFMGGGVPTSAAFNLSDQILNPVYGGTQLTAALEQLQVNLGVRMNAINSIQPTTLGGEMSPQFQGIVNPSGQAVTGMKTQKVGRFTIEAE